MKSAYSRRAKVTWVAAALLTIVGLSAYTNNAVATAPQGFTSTPLSMTTYGPVFSHVKDSQAKWSERIKTKGSTDFYVKQNTWDPSACGGCIPTTGWHTHPGPIFVTVTVGSVTVYDGDDPTCTPHVYSADSATNSFVDPGDGHVHIVRDETGALAQAIAVQLVPGDGPTRVDAADPGNCPF